MLLGVSHPIDTGERVSTRFGVGEDDDGMWGEAESSEGRMARWSNPAPTEHAFDVPQSVNGASGSGPAAAAAAAAAATASASVVAVGADDRYETSLPYSSDSYEEEGEEGRPRARHLIQRQSRWQQCHGGTLSSRGAPGARSAQEGDEGPHEVSQSVSQSVSQGVSQSVNLSLLFSLFSGCICICT